MVVNNDREWRWDQTKAKTFEGEDAAKAGRAFLMKAAGVDNINDAVRVLRGRPRVEEPREETVRLQVVVPKSWQAELDRSAAAEHGHPIRIPAQAHQAEEDTAARLTRKNRRRVCPPSSRWRAHPFPYQRGHRSRKNAPETENVLSCKWSTSQLIKNIVSKI